MDGIIKLSILGYLAYLAACPLVEFNAKQSWYQNYCDVRQCVRSGFGYERADAKQQQLHVQEVTFRTLCPGYLGGSWWDRNVRQRDRSWCEDYATRI